MAAKYFCVIFFGGGSKCRGKIFFSNHPRRSSSELVVWKKIFWRHPCMEKRKEDRLNIDFEYLRKECRSRDRRRCQGKMRMDAMHKGFDMSRRIQRGKDLRMEDANERGRRKHMNRKMDEGRRIEEEVQGQVPDPHHQGPMPARPTRPRRAPLTSFPLPLPITCCLPSPTHHPLLCNPLICPPLNAPTPNDGP